MGLLIITTLPSILILMYFVKGDKFPEPQDKILKTCPQINAPPIQNKNISMIILYKTVKNN